MDASPHFSVNHIEENAMNRSMVLGITLLAGAAIGGAMVQGIHAQTKPLTYVVVAVRKINDAAAYKAGVLDKAGPVIKAAGGRFVIRTDKITSFDGTPPQRLVLIA